MLLSSVMSGPESHTDREEDYKFLHSMLMEKKLHLLFKIHERLKRFEKRSPIPVEESAGSLASDLVKELMCPESRAEVTELVNLLSKPNFKSLLCVHDAVAQRDFEPKLPPIPDGVLEEDEDSVKIVSLVKSKEPLGATIKQDESTGAIVVARIMRGGAADKSGLIHAGDELREVNGVSLEHKKPKEVLPLLARSQGEVTFTVIPAATKEEVSTNKKKLFVRTLFDYDPKEDPTAPCKEVALAFRKGDVIQIVNRDDDTWWQARRHGDNNSWAGLIPSRQLHERRLALQRPKALFKPQRAKSAVVEDADYGAISEIHIAGLRRSFRLGRRGSRSSEVQLRRTSLGADSSTLTPTYMEVGPYRRHPKDRHCLVLLVGPGGVGVSELKRRLLMSNPDRYGVAIPHTTREKRRQEGDGVDYHFVSQRIFEEDILYHRFIEYGKHRGHYYGISLDSVHKVMAEGKVCLLDVQPHSSAALAPPPENLSRMTSPGGEQASSDVILLSFSGSRCGRTPKTKNTLIIRSLYTSEFKPFVVFVKPPTIEQLRLTRRRAKFTSEEGGRTPTRIFSEEDFEDMMCSAEAMEGQYGHLFDMVVVNGDIATAFRELKAELEKMREAEVQWIPVEWIRSSPTKATGIL